MKEHAADVSTCAYEGCSEPQWSGSADGYCCFHAPENGQDDETARMVWREGRERAKKARGNFTGWHFPTDRDHRWFAGVHFAVPNTGEDKHLTVPVFRDAVFHDVVSFKTAVFEGGVVFDGATFHGRAVIQAAVVNGPISLRSAHFFGELFVQGSDFVQTMDFSGATFKDSIVFSGNQLGGSFVFDRVSIAGLAAFTSCCFGKPSFFRHSRFDGGVSFCNSVFKAAPSFLGAASPSVTFLLPEEPPNVRPFSRAADGESAYRFAKRAAEASSDTEQAGQYHYAEKHAHGTNRMRHCHFRPWLKPERNWWHFKRWAWSRLHFYFNRWIFGYGERPMWVLRAGCVVWLLFALLYWQFGGIQCVRGRSLATLGNSLYFSAVTFSTLGYGDFKPEPAFRWMAGLEAVIGAALMALLVVALARKYTR